MLSLLLRQPPTVSFSHIHIYATSLKPLSHYKSLEKRCNDFSRANPYDPYTRSMPVEQFNAAWKSMDLEGYEQGAKSLTPDDAYVSQGRDLVSQLIVGLGFRLTGACDGVNTLSYLVTSPDPNGVQFVISTKKEGSLGTDELTHFDASRLDSFFGCHSQRQGIALLAFKADDVDTIFHNYKAKVSGVVTLTRSLRASMQYPLIRLYAPHWTRFVAARRSPPLLWGKELRRLQSAGGVCVLSGRHFHLPR